MKKVRDELYCSGCGAEIVGAPVLLNGQVYCCMDCAEGKPCECALVFEEEHRPTVEDQVWVSSY
ncbi:MAG: hypothetical protein JXA25_09440 [Anaerolineales bacterium]|nr:hypothetical protein [Anaerolineales bacterium]